MAIEPESEIETVTAEWLECRRTCITNPQQIILLRPDTNLGTLLLGIRNPNDQDYRYYQVGRRRFLEWMRDKVRQLESESP